MTELAFEAVDFGQLANISGTLSEGCHTVVGSARDGTGELLRLAAGLVRASSGRVTLDGAQAWSSSRVRRRIAAVCADEALPPGRDVAGSFQLALQARGDARSAVSVLEAAGLGAFSARPVSSLDARERRAVALGIALSHPDAQLTVLHEPLNLLDLVSEKYLFGALQRLSDSRAIVLCTANRLEDATRLGGEVSALERGLWLDSPRARLPLAAIVIRVQTPEPERLVECLKRVPEVLRTQWTSGQEVRVFGSEPEQVLRSIVSGARAAAIRIAAIKQDPAALEVLAAARAGLYEASPNVAGRGQS